MLGVLVNTGAILLGGTLGVLFKKAIPRRIADAIMIGVALCIVYIGISGSLVGQNALILIGSMVLGAVTGTLLDIDNAISRLGGFVEKKFSAKGEETSMAQGFVTASLLFCVGAMAVVGSLNAGFAGDNEMLYTKSILDGISSIMLASALGVGVIWSAAAILVYQGSIALLAGVLAPLLSDAAINEMSCVGSLLILALGLNMLEITKIKVANYLPAVIFAPILTMLIG